MRYNPHYIVTPSLPGGVNRREVYQKTTELATLI